MGLPVAVEIMAAVIAAIVLFAGIVALFMTYLHGTILIACGLLIAFLATLSPRV